MCSSMALSSHNETALAAFSLVGHFPAKTCNMDSQRITDLIPSVRIAASKAITSASDELWDVAPCFLHNHVIGTKVLGSTRHRYDPVVDLESSRSPAKLASQKRASQQSSGLSPTKHSWHQSFVAEMYEIRRCRRLSHFTFHLVTERARELTDQSVSGLPMREVYPPPCPRGTIVECPKASNDPLSSSN